MRTDFSEILPGWMGVGHGEAVLTVGCLQYHEIQLQLVVMERVWRGVVCASFHKGRCRLLFGFWASRPALLRVRGLYCPEARRMRALTGHTRWSPRWHCEHHGRWGKLMEPPGSGLKFMQARQKAPPGGFPGGAMRWRTVWALSLWWLNLSAMRYKNTLCWRLAQQRCGPWAAATAIRQASLAGGACSAGSLQGSSHQVP